MLKLILSLIILIKFRKEWNLIQLRLLFLRFLFSLSCCHDFFICELGYMFGIDYIRFIINILRIWIISLIIISRQKIKKYNQFYSRFVITNLLLLLFLILTFSCLDYIFFYIRFEMCLVPTLILIIGWGYQPERIQAGVYILFYTLVFSLPLLGSLLMYFNNNGRLIIILAERIRKGYSIRLVWYFCSVLAFMVKLPVYMFHLWLPKAHVEAPVAGSIILAGVLLKLGGYGLIRILTIFQFIRKELNWIWVGLGLIGGTYTSLICLRQIDIKSLIAYSSVAHISLVLCGLMIFSYWGVRGAVIVIIGHGLCSSGLFCLANVVYERINRRSLFIVKGLLNFIPRIGLWWFLLRVRNIASPPSLNLLGEIRLIIRVLSWRKVRIVGVRTLSFFRAAYTLYIYRLRQHGLFFRRLYSCCSGKIREYLLMFLHWFPLNVLILNTNIIMI